MTSNNEYYQDILRIVSGETISTYETTLNLMKKICLAYGCTYTDAQCSNKYLKDFAEASIGTTYSEPKLNIEYLHDIAVNFYPATVEGTENYYLGIIADYISVTPKLHTDLTIDVPLVLVYSDEFNITGVLTDENDDPVANATIELLIGNTIVDTTTSNSQGQVSFTKSPVSMGNHTFQLRYNGDTGYYATTSSIVSRTINKETRVLNVSLPLDNANYYDYENIAVTGTLYDNDGELIDNATVKVYNSSTLLESVNVSNGSFSISNLSDIAGTLGDYTLTIIYEGNDYYTASSITRTIHIIEEVQYDGISLTSDKSILSYYDSESATLTAQLKNGTSDVAVSGVAIEWFVDGVSKGSINTNNSGRSVFTYNSAGVGDVTIEAKLSSSVSETYAIEDCFFYGINTDAFTIPSSTTFSSNGEYITATTSTSGEKLVYLNHTLSNTDNWIFENEVAYKGSSEQVLSIIWNDNSFYGGQGYGENYVYSYMGSQTKKTHTVQIGDKFTVKRENGVTSVYINDELIESQTISHKASFRVGYFINRNRTQYYKNIKLKPL